MVQAISRFDLLEAAKLHGRRVVAVASFLSLVCIFCAFWSWIPHWKYSDRPVGLICILPFWVPYGFVLVRLYEGRVLSGLVLAGTMGCALFVPGVLLMRFVIEWQRSWWIGTNLAVALLMQLVIVVAAVVSLKYMQIDRRNWFKISGSLQCGIYGIVLLAIFRLAYSPTPLGIIDNESKAEGRLRAISWRNDQNYLYDAFYRKGSSPPMEEIECHSDGPLGPPNPAAGYIFEYRAVVSETSVRGCKLDTSFIISARPVVYRKTGIRSFLVDRRTQDDKWPKAQYIRIHFTLEDRPATLSDPADEVELFKHRFNPQ
jgi:hypothetical protein